MAIFTGTGVTKSWQRSSFVSRRGQTAGRRQGRRHLAAAAAAQLHDRVPAVGLGRQQGAVGAAEHRLRRVAGLDFGDAEADRHRPAVHLRLDESG